ncbi:MAG: hypothetical protein H8E73_04465, partial [Planctomycetes bacterium]|nr:hypothetical protein [Planctomycetota bacterium]
KDSNVAICTLWTEKKKILKNVSDEKYNICGNLYNANGINYIIKNVLANPLIRYIVLCGRDLRFSGEATPPPAITFRIFTRTSTRAMLPSPRSSRGRDIAAAP